MWPTSPVRSISESKAVSSVMQQPLYLEEMGIPRQGWLLDAKLASLEHSPGTPQQKQPCPRTDVTGFENMKPLVILFKMIGALPFRNDEHGQPRIRIRSVWTAYSVLLYTAIMVATYMTAEAIVREILTAQSFDRTVVYNMALLLLMPYTLVPVTIWYESRKISDFSYIYTKFHSKYHQVTGKTLTKNSFKKQIFWLMFHVTNSCSSVLLCIYISSMATWYIVPYYFNFSMLSLQVATWAISSDNLRMCGVAMAHDFKEAFSKDPSTRTISDYRSLWLELSTLCSKKGYANCYTIGSLILVLVAALSLGLYAFLEDLPSIKSFVVGLGFLYYFGMLFSIFHHPHYVTEQVADSMKRELEVIRVSSVGGAVYNEIRIFVQEISSNPPVISLGGYVNINKETFGVITATLMTYLIVLLQMKLSTN